MTTIPGRPISFVTWWERIGSGIKPTALDDMESHARRVASVAWSSALMNCGPEPMVKCDGNHAEIIPCIDGQCWLLDAPTENTHE